MLRGLVVLTRLETVARVIPVPQFLQPRAEAFQIPDGLATGDVIHFGMRLASRHLSELKVLGEYGLLVDFDLIHIF